MNEADVERLLDQAVARGMAAQRENNGCNLSINKDQHDNEHDFLRGLIAIADRMDKVKWGFLGAAAKTIGTLLITALVVGLIVLARQYKGSLP